MIKREFNFYQKQSETKILRYECFLMAFTEVSRKKGYYIPWKMLLLLKMYQFESITTHDLFMCFEGISLREVKEQVGDFQHRGWVKNFPVKGERSLMYYLTEDGIKEVKRLKYDLIKSEKKYKRHFYEERDRIWRGVRPAATAAPEGCTERQEAETGTEV